MDKAVGAECRTRVPGTWTSPVISFGTARPSSLMLQVSLRGYKALVLTSTTDKKLSPAWSAFHLHPQLGRALYSKKFTTPTPIQAEALPLALKGKDVVGVAETVRAVHTASCLLSN